MNSIIPCILAVLLAVNVGSHKELQNWKNSVVKLTPKQVVKKVRYRCDVTSFYNQRKTKIEDTVPTKLIMLLVKKNNSEFLVNSNALQCFECEQDDKHSCSWETKTCSEAETHCFRISVPRPDGVEYIKRGCLEGDSCEVVSKGVKVILQTLFHIEVDPNCTTCQTDKCNSATKLTGFTFFGLVLAAAAFLL